jgi:hypothetical protein
LPAVQNPRGKKKQTGDSKHHLLTKRRKNKEKN